MIGSYTERFTVPLWGSPFASTCVLVGGSVAAANPRSSASEGVAMHAAPNEGERCGRRPHAFPRPYPPLPRTRVLAAQ